MMAFTKEVNEPLLVALALAAWRLRYATYLECHGRKLPERVEWVLRHAAAACSPSTAPRRSVTLAGIPAPPAADDKARAAFERFMAKPNNVAVVAALGDEAKPQYPITLPGFYPDLG